ncbi:MAG: hypothetical protein IT328_22975 [Caldilineaceae bacterium]|nr:hypothetical protein [Caldilineaceae bacterium]
MESEIVRVVERKGEIMQAKPQRFVLVQRAAEQLSRRNADAAIVELMMEAMQRLTLLAYEQDADGYCNIDDPTGRLLIPAPWGRAGYKRWAITPSESVILREMIQRRQIGRNGRGPGLWLYDASRRCWRLNLYDYDRLSDGQAYWQRWPLTVAEYRQARSRRLEGGVVGPVVGPVAG